MTTKAPKQPTTSTAPAAPIRLTPAMRVPTPRRLTRGVLGLAASMLAGGMLLAALLLSYGAPIGVAFVELGLRLQSAGTRPIYVVSVAPGLEDDARVQTVVQRLAVDAVTEEAIRVGLGDRAR